MYGFRPRPPRSGLTTPTLRVPDRGGSKQPTKIAGKGPPLRLFFQTASVGGGGPPILKKGFRGPPERSESTQKGGSEAHFRESASESPLQLWASWGSMLETQNPGKGGPLPDRALRTGGSPSFTPTFRPLQRDSTTSPRWRGYLTKGGPTSELLRWGSREVDLAYGSYSTLQSSRNGLDQGHSGWRRWWGSAPSAP